MAATNQALLDFLAGPALTELMMSFDVKRGLPDYWPQDLFKVSTQKPVGTKAIWDHRTGQRQAATIVNDMAPSRQYIPPAQTRSEVTCIVSREHMVIDAELMLYLKSGVSILSDRAKRKIIEDLKDFKVRFTNLRNAAVGSMFGFGKISYLPAGTGSALDASGGVPTGSGQIVNSGTSGAITVDPTFTYAGANALSVGSVIPNSAGSATVSDWATTTNDITADLREIFEGFIKTNGYRPRNIMYGRNIPSYFAKNTFTQAAITRQPSLNLEFMSTNEVPKGLLDYNWHPAYRDYFLDYTGTIRPYVAADQIVIYPDVTEEWYEFVEAGTLIPKSLVPPGFSIEQAMEAAQLVWGYASYTEMINDPACTPKIIAVDGFVPLPKVATSVWSITVH